MWFHMVFVENNGGKISIRHIDLIRWSVLSVAWQQNRPKSINSSEPQNYDPLNGTLTLEDAALVPTSNKWMKPISMFIQHMNRMKSLTTTEHQLKWAEKTTACCSHSAIEIVWSNTDTPREYILNQFSISLTSADEAGSSGSSEGSSIIRSVPVQCCRVLNDSSHNPLQLVSTSPGQICRGFTNAADSRAFLLITTRSTPAER